MHPNPDATAFLARLFDHRVPVLDANQARVLAAIPFDSEPVKSDDLARLASCDRERRTQAPLRQTIRELVLLGFPILSKSTGRTPGFMLTSNPEELATYALSLRSRTRSIVERAEAIEATALRLGAASGYDHAQLELF